MENQSPNKKLQEIEKNCESLATKSKVYTASSLAVVIAGVMCLKIGTEEMNGFLVYAGYGLFVVAISLGISMVCQLLSNILKVHILSYKKANGIQDVPKPTQNSPEPQMPKATYLGGIKLENE